MKNYRFRFFSISALLVAASMSSMIRTADAQTCPAGKTVFLWSNGILTAPSEWFLNVRSYQNDFTALIGSASAPCVLFEDVYNNSDGIWHDLIESTFGISLPIVANASYWNTLPNISRAEAMAGAMAMFSKDITTARTYSSDLDLLLLRIKYYRSLHYRVVLVGHSEGSVYTNAAYNREIRDNAGLLPDYSQLSVVNIATPAAYVADGRNKYTTSCEDIIVLVPGSLPSNIVPISTAECSSFATAGSTGIAGAVASLLLLNPQAFLASLGTSFTVLLNGIANHFANSYMYTGSNARKQIMEQLYDSLPYAPCYSDDNCLFSDRFPSAGDYRKNWTVSDNMTAQFGISQTGALLMSLTDPGILLHDPYHTGQLTLRSRRVFSGSFKIDLSFYHTGNGRSTISLKRAVDNSTVVSITLDARAKEVSMAPSANVSVPISNFAGWKNLSIAVTSSSATLSSGGMAATTSVNSGSGYYLEFDARTYHSGDFYTDNDSLFVSDLSVSRTPSTAGSSGSSGGPAGAPTSPAGSPGNGVPGSNQPGGGTAPTGPLSISPDVTKRSDGLVIFNARPTGGSGAYSCTWDIAPSAKDCQIGIMYSNGTYPLTVAATDGTGAQKRVSLNFVVTATTAAVK
ncbi:MAG: hypothetical protein ABJC09_11355 [Terriglobia bacterium]